MRVFISTSSSSGVSNEYLHLASDVATILAKKNHKLLFNGKSDGMLEKIYMTFKYEGMRTKAICDVKEAENLKYLELDAKDVLANTFKRTESLYASSELIVFLPGSIGSLAEFFSILEEVKTRSYNIPIILFNYNNFYTPILNMLVSMYKDKFIKESDLKLFSVVNDIKSFETYIDTLGKEE